MLISMTVLKIKPKKQVLNGSKPSPQTTKLSFPSSSSSPPRKLLRPWPTRLRRRFGELRPQAAAAFTLPARSCVDQSLRATRDCIRDDALKNWPTPTRQIYPEAALSVSRYLIRAAVIEA
ncbi:hypothetical protein NL676_031990 [Syzygium grande]|nr:hypothetical protein NL676_031990 [Syzygium grande]